MQETKDLPAWESLIKDRMRPTAPRDSEEDPVKRNRKLTAIHQQRKWRAQNPEKSKEIVMKSRKKNWEHYLEVQRQWRARNPEKMKEYRERNKANVKAWALAHPERRKQLDHESYLRRKDQAAARYKKYLAKPGVKEHLREYDHKRNQTPERKAYERERAARRRAEKKQKELELNKPTIGTTNEQRTENL